MSVIHISTHDFQEAVVRSERPVLPDFRAGWCSPCRPAGPISDGIDAGHSDITVGKINVDGQPEPAVQFGITSIPTTAVMKNGRIVKQAAGASPRAQIPAML